MLKKKIRKFVAQAVSLGTAFRPTFLVFSRDAALKSVNRELCLKINWMQMGEKREKKCRAMLNIDSFITNSRELLTLRVSSRHHFSSLFRPFT